MGPSSLLGAAEHADAFVREEDAAFPDGTGFGADDGFAGSAERHEVAVVLRQRDDALHEGEQEDGGDGYEVEGVH